MDTLTCNGCAVEPSSGHLQHPHVAQRLYTKWQGLHSPRGGRVGCAYSFP